MTRPQLYLLGGSSSVGKTTAATEIAGRLGIALFHVDSLLSTFSDPMITFPSGVPSVWQRPAEALRDGLIAKSHALEPHLTSIIAHHLMEGQSAVIEGEGITPRLASRWTSLPAVRCVIVVEDDAEHIHRTLLARSADGRFEQLPVSERWAVARMNALYGRWLRESAVAYGVPWVSSQPFQTLAEKGLAALSHLETATTPYITQPMRRP